MNTVHVSGGGGGRIIEPQTIISSKNFVSAIMKIFQVNSYFQTYM